MQCSPFHLSYHQSLSVPRSSARLALKHQGRRFLCWWERGLVSSRLGKRQISFWAKVRECQNKNSGPLLILKSLENTARTKNLLRFCKKSIYTCKVNPNLWQSSYSGFPGLSGNIPLALSQNTLSPWQTEVWTGDGKEGDTSLIQLAPSSDSYQRDLQ